MNTVLAMAISPNGLIAREDGNEDWLPKENWKEFLQLAMDFQNIVMGRETYELVTKLYPDYNFDNVNVPTKVIVTRDRSFRSPSNYKVVHSPEQAIAFVKEIGHNKVFLIGGGKLNSEFLKRGLVNQISFTITPHIIGKGRPVIHPYDFDIPLELLSSETLSGGRVRLTYKVV